MIRRPPRSTLFPSTTLSRSAVAAGDHRDAAVKVEHLRRRHNRISRGRSRACRAGPRSEEHTSELQSHLNLVCRLLLEKKNTQIHTPLTKLPYRREQAMRTMS